MADFGHTRCPIYEDCLMNAHSPQYGTSDCEAINLTVEHPDFGWIPFTARADDAEPLGADLYARAAAGEFGPIAAYVGPSAEEMLADQVRAERASRLAQLDAIVANPSRWVAFTAEQQGALAAYRQALLDVPQQDGFPGEVDWPEMPAL